MRLPNERRGAIDGAVCKCLVDLRSSEFQLQRGQAQIARRGRLEAGECRGRLIQMPGGECVFETGGHHRRNSLQTVQRFAVCTVDRGGRAVIDQRVIARRLGVAPLAHRQPCLLQ